MQQPSNSDAAAILGGAPLVEAPLDRHVRWPIIDQASKEAVNQVLDRGVLSGHFAPEVRRLEREFAQYIGVRHCLATNSGTAALHLALAALGVGPGDEVIVPAFTFVASALAVMHQGAKPVFVDIETETWGMDPELVRSAITPQTKAIMPVHIHGTPCKMDEIMSIAETAGVPVVEDACQAHGAVYRGRKVGGIGRIAAFSTQSSKNLASGEGGLLVSDDRELMELASRMRMFGEDIPLSDESTYDVKRASDAERGYDSAMVGWMYRTNEMSAAIAHTQLAELEKWNQRARDNADYLSSCLAELPGITPPQIPEDCTAVYHKYRVCFDPKAIGLNQPSEEVRKVLVAALKAEGVEAVLWQTKPVPAQRLFLADYDESLYPKTIHLLQHSICLFSQTFPMAAQDRELIADYAKAFAKVWSQLPAIFEKQNKGTS